jgi:hypothetical protein
VLTGQNGRQSLENVRVEGFDGYCIDFETLEAGSQFRATQIDVKRVNAPSGSGRYAIHVADGFMNQSVPRSFVQLETGGSPAIYLGGCNGFYVTASTMADLEFTSESRGAHFSTSRLMNQENLVIKGHGITFMGVGFSPSVTIDPGATEIRVGEDTSYFNRTAPAPN